VKIIIGAENFNMVYLNVIQIKYVLIRMNQVFIKPLIQCILR